MYGERYEPDTNCPRTAKRERSQTCEHSRSAGSCLIYIIVFWFIPRASMIWIIGEYAERIDNAAELLESFLEGFQDENSQVCIKENFIFYNNV